MIAKYYIELDTPLGVPIDIVSDFEYLQFTSTLNDIGIAKFGLAETHSSLTKFEIGAIIKIWRWHPEINSGVSTNVFAGLFQGFIYKLHDGKTVVEIIFPDANVLLQNTVNAYKAGILNRSYHSGPAGAVIDNIIFYNLGGGEAGVRLIDPIGGGNSSNRLDATGIFTGVSIVRGNEFKNLLSEIQNLCEYNGLQWIVTYNSGVAFTATFTYGSYAADKVVFDYRRGNIIESELDDRNINEITKVLVLGQGESSNRITRVRTSNRYSKYNHTEATVNANDISDTTELDALGDALIEAARHVPELRFTSIQTPGCRWGIDYNLGDIVGTNVSGVSFLQRIAQISVSVTSDGEDIGIGLRKVQQPEIVETIAISEVTTVVRV